MNLFEDVDASISGPMSHHGDEYTYYCKSDREDIAALRQRLENWFTNYPMEHKKDLKHQFKESFSSAYFELFLHELFLKQGFNLTPHPKIEGTEKRPDFLVEGNGIEFYLEAKEATDISQKEKAIEKRTKTIYQAIDAISLPDHFIGISTIKFKTEGQPPTKKICEYIEKTVKANDPDTLERYFAVNNNFPIVEYNDENVSFEFDIIPKSKEGRNTKTRAIGFYKGDAKFIDNDKTIKEAIKRKALRYGAIDKPFIVCINATGHLGLDENEVMNALFGSLAFSYNLNAPIEFRNEKWIRQPDGFFFSKSGPQYTRVSGVLITNVNVANYADAPYRLIMHPSPKIELDWKKLGLSCGYYSELALTFSDPISFGDILSKSSATQE